MPPHRRIIAGMTLDADQLAHDARATLADLVGFDTTSRGSNLALIAYAEAKLQAAGARTTRVLNREGTKANLMASIGPDAPGGVILSGHTDVVPVDGQAWSSDPWTLTERDGRLYGRGTCDMKGFLALALSAAEGFAAADLARPIHYALSYDEEIGCLGAPAMIARMASDLPPVDAAIIGEPTEMKVISAHKGLSGFDVELIGHEAHSSLVGQEGACAVTHMVPLMRVMLEIAEELRAAAPADSPFDPPYGTLTIGKVYGGTAENILAGRAGFVSLMRPAPWDDADAVEARLRAKAAEVEAVMRRTAPTAAVRVTRLSNVPALAVEDDGAAERLARALTGDNERRTASYGTEGGQFQRGGFSAVICGPGSIAQAHQPDEYIALEQLSQGAAFLSRLGTRLAS